MKQRSSRDGDVVALVASNDGRARVVITGTSMRPLLRAGMVVDVEPLARAPRVGEILVFRSQTSLVAHRFVGLARMDRDDVLYLTAGDAHPDRIERVPPRLVVGRVTAVRAGAAADARRIDGFPMRAAGWAYARTRRQRSSLVAARRYASLAFADPRRIAPPPAFGALVTATRHFEAKRFEEGIDALVAVPQRDAIATARRHHASGLISAWLDDAAAAGVPTPPALHDAFRRTRWNNALQAGRVVRTVGDVRDRFVAARIPHVFLKGGARLATDEPGADLHFSCDVDVLVPAATIEAAGATLRTAGYREIFDRARSARYDTHHHRAPVQLAGQGVPVEIHVALVLPDLVSEALDFQALAPHLCRDVGAIGEIVILDNVAAALHLAYHARDLHVWRDVVLLARKLASFSSEERSWFDARIGAERRDSLRLMSVVVAADRVAAHADVALLDGMPYLAWAVAREDLPRGIPRCDVIETIVGRCRVDALRVTGLPDIPALLWLVVKNLAFLPLVVRLARPHRTRRTASLGARR